MLAAANYGAEHCAEIGDKHFTMRYLTACKQMYAIDIKDKKADVRAGCMHALMHSRPFLGPHTPAHHFA